MSYWINLEVDGMKTSVGSDRLATPVFIRNEFWACSDSTLSNIGTQNRESRKKENRVGVSRQCLVLEVARNHTRDPCQSLPKKLKCVPGVGRCHSSVLS